MTDEWGPWQDHDGKGCPCVGMVVNIQTNTMEDTIIVAGRSCLDAGISPDAPYSAWVWTETELAYGIRSVIRYRIRKPRALIQLIDMVENLPVQESEDA